VVQGGVVSQDLICLQMTVSSTPGRSSSNNYLLDHWQNPWLCIVVSVGSNSKIDFLVECVSSVGRHKPEKGILWSLWHSICCETGRR
jgi:hypothetical protein